MMPSIEADFWAELAQIQAKSIGWIPFDDGAYVHLGADFLDIEVIGLTKTEMQGSRDLQRDCRVSK
jgi:hypothetical protein